jgi:hypothetical protein
MAAIDTHPSIFFVALALISIILAVLIVWLFLALRKFQQRYDNIARAAETGNLAELIAGQADELRGFRDDLGRMERAQGGLSHNLSFAVQRVGLIRFDAFDDVGGKLSFAAALLDSRGDGLVICSINGRQENRVYAKPIKASSSVFTLSIEEKEAIAQALG